MGRTIKKITTLALVSSVASLALIPVDADAQRSRKASLPSVEVHLEVLGSLRQSIANRARNQTYAAQPSVAPVSSGSFASEVAQQIPAGNRQVVQQPLPSRAKTRVASAAVPRGKVIMQQLPSKRIASVEPTEEHIIMQEMPLGESAFPVASGLDTMPALEPIAVAEVQEKKSILDKVSGWFSSDDEPQELTHPMLKTPELAVAQAPVVLPNDTFVAVGEIASDALQGAAIVPSAVVPMVRPEIVSPSQEMIARILAPEIAKEAPMAPLQAVEPIVALQQPAAQELAIPDNFAVAEKLPQAAVLAMPKINNMPVEVVTSTPALTEPDAIAFEPFEPQVSNDEAGFPRLNEVETQSAIGALVQDIPDNAQDWLSDGVPQLQVPAPTIDAIAKSEMPAMPVMKSKVVKQKLEMPPSILQKIAKPKVVVKAPKPVPAPIVEKIVEARKVVPIAAPKTPMVEKKNIIASPKAEIVKKVSEPIAVPDFSFSSAEESLLTSAKNPEKVPLLEDKDEVPLLEMALDELEPETPGNVSTGGPDFSMLDDLEVPDDAPVEFAIEEPVKELAKVAELEPEPKLELSPEPKLELSPEPVAEAKKSGGMFPGITRTFRNLLDDEKKPSMVTGVPVADPADVPVFDKQEVAKNVMPPELPVASAAKETSLPSMDLLDKDIEGRFTNEPLDSFESESVDLLDLEPEKLVPEMAAPEFEVAALPPQPKLSKPSVKAAVGATQVSINYGKDDTDIPESNKSKLKDIANKAKAAKKRIIISSFASGEEDESKAANMISLSRGLSLRAYFIDRGVAMDRIIVQAKGLENAGGAPDRADIVIE